MWREALASPKLMMVLRGGFRIASVCAALSLAAAQPVRSYPRNPQRPMDAKTCDEAQTRLREARLGSPIISAAENRAVLLKATENAERLCGKSKTNESK